MHLHRIRILSKLSSSNEQPGVREGADTLGAHFFACCNRLPVGACSNNMIIRYFNYDERFCADDNDSFHVPITIISMIPTGGVHR